MLGNIIINGELYGGLETKSFAKKKKNKEKIMEKRIRKRESIRKQKEYVAEKRKATILTHHSKIRIDERIKLKEDTIKANVYKSLLNKRCILEYSQVLDNYRLFSGIATYILSNELVLVTVMPPLKRNEYKKVLYKLVTNKQRARILERLGFDLDYHENRKKRLE